MKVPRTWCDGRKLENISKACMCVNHGLNYELTISTIEKQLIDAIMKSRETSHPPWSRTNITLPWAPAGRLEAQANTRRCCGYMAVSATNSTGTIRPAVINIWSTNMAVELYRKIKREGNVAPGSHCGIHFTHRAGVMRTEANNYPTSASVL